MKVLPKKRILLFQIKYKRKHMYAKARHFGLTHPDVVAVSQELDMLLNEYQGIRSL